METANRYALCTQSVVFSCYRVIVYTSYEELPLLLNAATVADVLGIAPSSAYELMHEKGFPILKTGNRLLVPKAQFIKWVDENTEGGK